MSAVAGRSSRPSRASVRRRPVSARTSGSGAQAAGDSALAARRLSDEAIEIIAATLRVIGEPTRIRLLGFLNEGDATVQELTDRLMTTHQNVSKHLGILYQAGMVSRRKEGTSVRYALVDWTGWWLVEQIGQSVAAHLDELRDVFRPPDDDEAS